jgi:hypothetical protein
VWKLADQSAQTLIGGLVEAILGYHPLGDFGKAPHDGVFSKRTWLDATKEWGNRKMRHNLFSEERLQDSITF